MTSRITRPDPGELRRLYVDEHLTIAQIADRFGVAAQTVHNWMVAASIARRKGPATPRSDINDDEIVDLYQNRQWSAQQIASHLGCGTTTIYHRLERLGIPRHTTGPRQTNRPDDNELRALYLDQHLSLRQIATRQHVSPQTVRAWLTTARIPLRPPGVPLPQLDDQTLAQQYRLGRSAPDLAAQHGCSTSTIYRRLEATGIARRPPTHAIDRATLTTALAAGFTAPQIADAAGTSIKTVCRALAREQLETATQATRRRSAERCAQLLAEAERDGTCDPETLEWLRAHSVLPTAQTRPIAK